MHPSIRETLVHALAASRAGCLATALDDLAAVGATVSFSRPTRAGWRSECTITGIGAPSIETTDDAGLSFEPALEKLIKRVHVPAEAA